MQTSLYIAGLGVLLLIFYQDLRYRGVSWYLFPVGLIFLWASTSEELSSLSYWSGRALNLGFLVFQLALLSVYFAWKKISFRQFWKEYMGLGDVLFFILLALVLPFPFFPLFMVGSLILSLLLAVVAFRGTTVPLAGLQALLLAVVLAVQPLSGCSFYEFNMMY